MPSTGAKINASFNRVTSGDCLMCGHGTPSAAIVSCADEHRFERSLGIDMRTFPGMEYGQNAPHSADRRTVRSCCAPLPRHRKFDPNSSSPSAYCGPATGRGGRPVSAACSQWLAVARSNQQLAFKGKVADIDQSKVTMTGTCLGIVPHNQPIDVGGPARHRAMEVAAVSLAENPTRAGKQDGFIKDACADDGRLAPQVAYHHLTLIYPA